MDDEGILEAKEAMTQILRACAALGWHAAIPGELDDEDTVAGLVIGTPQFLTDLFGAGNLERVDDETPGH